MARRRRRLEVEENTLLIKSYHTWPLSFSIPSTTTTTTTVDELWNKPPSFKVPTLSTFFSFIPHLFQPAHQPWTLFPCTFYLFIHTQSVSLQQWTLNRRRRKRVERLAICCCCCSGWIPYLYSFLIGAREHIHIQYNTIQPPSSTSTYKYIYI